MNRSTRVVAGLLVALGACAQPSEDPRASSATLTGGRPGEIALLPEVQVDGLEALTNRSVGTVFVQEVLLNASAVQLWDAAGVSRDIRGGVPYFLRYNPGAGEAGLSRLWAPADGRYETLSLDVGPMDLTDDEVAQESRSRGIDLSALRHESVVIHGVMVTESRGPQGVGVIGHAAGGQPCEGRRSRACEGTVPDTAPADDKVATVPDTAPARDEVATAKGGAEVPAEGGATTRTYRTFSLVTAGRFTLGTDLDPLVMEGGGAVKLHLDVNAIFTDARLEDLREAARQQGAGDVVRAVSGGEMMGSVTVHTAGVRIAPEYSPH